MDEKKDLSFFDRQITELRDKRQRILDGKVNCIPLKFPRYKFWLPGIEKERYVIVTANQKVGKSKLSDDMYVYAPFFYALQNPEKVRYKVLYFTLEMSKEEKYNEFLCHLLYRLDNIRISPSDLKSVHEHSPVPEYILDLLETEKYQKIIKKFEETVIYVDNERNPTGINKFCRRYAMENGTLHLKTVKDKDEFTGLPIDKEVPDYYEPNDPDEYRTIIIDNFSNLNTESGKNKFETIQKMSQYIITLRNQLKYNIVAIQHQAQAQESLMNFKEGKLKPSSDGLGDAKTTSRDANLVLGLFSPFKHGLRDWEGYDITRFKNRIRFLEILENRNGAGAGQVCPLYFDGAVSVFEELPLPKDTVGLDGIYKYIESIEHEEELKQNELQNANKKVQINTSFFAWVKNKLKIK